MKDYYIGTKSVFDEKVVLGKTRVILINDEYGVRTPDPVWGSSYQCVGTVERVSKVGTDFPIIVGWDNGSSSAYRTTDLHIYSAYGTEKTKSNPNFTFKREKQKGDG